MSSVGAASPLPHLERVGRVTQRRVFLSEWTKLWSVRSTRWSFVAAIAFTIGIAALACAVVSHHWPHLSPQDRADFNPLEPNLAGVQLAQLALGVLGVLVITAEYSTGMIRASMTAVPRRLPVLWGKAIVFGLVTLALMVPSTLIAFVVGEWIFSGRDINVAFSAPGVARAVIGAGLYLTVVGVFGLGLGAIVRNTAGGIATFAGIMFVLPPLMNVLPRSWNDAASPTYHSRQARRSCRRQAETTCPHGSASASCAPMPPQRLPSRRFSSSAATHSRPRSTLLRMDAEHARTLLAGERARIERALASAAHDGDGSNELDDPASLASDTYQDEYDEGLRDDLRRALAAVERAEARLDAGTYGFSVESGNPIPDERLEAVPSAELTVEEERREGSKSARRP